jgi:signal transduction histidine kinase
LEVSRQQVEDEAAKLVHLNAQLEESEEKLKELNDSKDKFFSIIGHDLKNPFQAILNLSEILKNEFADLNDEEKLQFIEMIGEASESAHRLLENLLAWSRSQTGRIDFTLEPIQLKKVVANVVHLLLPQAENKHITLIGEISPTIMVNADRNMLDTILRNLTSNAIKFTNQDGTVKILAVEEEDFIQLSVADNGIGLTEIDKNKLFKVGVKNSEIGRSKEKGTGLGLILCKEFVEKHGGKIWVESEINKGTEFKFTIPKVN